jgi:MFS transporter, AAHS family, 4-hydroxybenzoate transporter
LEFVMSTANTVDGWDAQSVVLAAAVPAMLAGGAVIALRRREPELAIMSPAAALHH